MNKKIKKIKKKFNNGFSLMETLIWVTIVSIFISITGFSMFKFLGRAKVIATKQEIQTFATALLSYSDTEGKLPSDDEGLMALVEKDYIVINSAEGKVVDKWKNEYIYTLINNDNDFIIKSLGSDKQEGGEGTKADIIYSSTNEGDGFGESNNLDYGSDFDLE
jgi:general secretion pathway protein G